MSPEARWSALLDELERRARGSSDETAFDPGAPGPLPESLLERARSVLELQRAQAAALRAASVRVRRQLSAARATPLAATRAPAAYLDVNG